MSAFTVIEIGAQSRDTTQMMKLRILLLVTCAVALLFLCGFSTPKKALWVLPLLSVLYFPFAGIDSIIFCLCYLMAIWAVVGIMFAVITIGLSKEEGAALRARMKL
jgi:hypothetical protein